MSEYAWVALSLMSAFLLATSDALAKRALDQNNEYLVAWFRLIFALPPLVFALLLAPVPELDQGFWTAFLIALPVELVTIVLYIKALKLSPMSLSLPFLALTPVFLIVVSYAVLGETLTIRGAAGILLIASGSYLLNLSEVRRGFLKPFRAILREPGAILMIGVAFLYSITSSMGKMAIEHSSPVFFGATYFIALAACFSPIGYAKGRGELASFMRSGKYRATIVPGVLYGLMVLFHMSAMKLTKVAYMVSVKRTCLLMGVLYGYFMFHEGKLRERFLGAALMFAGFVLVVTAR